MPFYNVPPRKDYALMARIVDGLRPNRPSDIGSHGVTISDQYWHLIESCWNGVPDQRPPMDQVLRQIEEGIP
jgi:hypothetical protein